MEIFNYADWLAEGRRAAKAKGTPNLDTEILRMYVLGDNVHIQYYVKLKTVDFQIDVAKMTIEEFSTRFMSMLEVSEEA